MIAQCNWCGTEQRFSYTKIWTPTLKRVEKKLLEWNWVRFDNNIFCSAECRDRYVQEDSATFDNDRKKP